MGEAAYDAVLFDLLTALLDSWTLWNNIAGSAEAGQRWRAEYLRAAYQTGSYRSYTDLVREAAVEAHYSELQPWPETRGTLRCLAEAGIPLGVVRNCSEKLGGCAGRRDCPLTGMTEWAWLCRVRG